MGSKRNGESFGKATRITRSKVASDSIFDGNSADRATRKASSFAWIKQQI
jgi:hypothetical protein